MNMLISGGCKNGKSYFAQQEANKRAKETGKPLYYIATMIPKDKEDQDRIKRHKKEREGWGFQTLEQGTDICRVLDLVDVDSEGIFLLDSLTALLSNEMFKSDGTIDANAPEKVKRDLLKFAQRTGNTIFVSDYIYSDAQPYESWTEAYRRGLALADRALAAECEQVVEVAYGATTLFKP